MTRRRIPEDVRIAGRIYRFTGGLFVRVDRHLFPYHDEKWRAFAYRSERSSNRRFVRYSANGKTPRAALVNLWRKVRMQ